MKLNTLFILLSFFLGCIISFYYIQAFTLPFIYLVIIITFILYVLFYFLGGGNQEHFQSVYFRNSMEDMDIEEELHTTLSTQPEKITDVVSSNQSPVSTQSSVSTVEEETISNPYPISYTLPDTNTYVMNDILPVQTDKISNYLPVNINIQYNPPETTKEVNVEKSRNLGSNLERNGRIYNNSDWIYGTYAWTDNPDYYIPDKRTETSLGIVPKPYTNTSTNLSSNSRVCPLTINSPWAEYKSGDSN